MEQDEPTLMIDTTGPGSLQQLQPDLLRQRQFEAWLRDGVGAQGQRYDSDLLGGELLSQAKFELPILRHVKDRLFHTDFKGIHWDDEIRRVLTSMMTVGSISISSLRAGLF